VCFLNLSPMKSELEKLYLETRQEWRFWLDKYHSIEKGIFLIYYKKHTGKPRIPYDDAVEEALCYGWIDSIVKRIDDEKYMQKFTPRNHKSQWSETNKKRVEKMIAEGKMTEAGLEKIKIAKENGKWDEVTDAKKQFVLSSDLFNILESDIKAHKEFGKLLASLKKNYISWIMSAKKEETRERRLRKMIEMLVKGQKMF